jgi:hypothetical protein
MQIILHIYNLFPLCGMIFTIPNFGVVASDFKSMKFQVTTTTTQTYSFQIQNR